MSTPSTATPVPTPDVTESEAYVELCEIAKGKTGRLPAGWVARQALRVTEGGDFPLQRAALEAIMRRIASARREGLRPGARPVGPLGLWRTARDGAALPYRTRVSSVAPFRGSCDCRDFLRNSLGLCKHLATVLEDLAKRKLLDAPPRGKVRALPLGPEPGLVWDPLRPLTGPGDPLERIRWQGVLVGERPRIEAVFPRDGRLRETFAGRPDRRLALVSDLLGLARASPGTEPAVLPLLSEERDRLSRQLDGCTRAEVDRFLATLERPLYPYQVEGVRRFLAEGRLLLADDMGLGKTAQAIAGCHVLFHAGRVRRGLLVVPAALKPQWLREWREFTRTPVEIVDGAAQERRKLLTRRRAGFLIANYEQVLRDLPWMQRYDPDLVVLDEAQRIKNWETKTASQVKRLTPRWRLVLTGTPMENRLDELASIVEWVDDTALEPKWRLAPWHSVAVDGRGEVAGARHLDTLRQRLSGCLLRRVRREVLRQLPSRTDTQIPVPLTAAQQERHDELIPPIRQILARARRRPLTQADFLKLMSLFTMQRMIANGLAQIDFDEVWPALAGARPTDALLAGLGSPKLMELRELIANVAVAQQRKIVVFSQWRRMLRLAQWAISDLLCAAGLRSVFFTGEESGKRRTQNLVDFHDDPATRILFASDAGGVGLNLQRASSCCICLELPWNPAVLEQRIGRVHRLGQKTPVEVYRLVAQGSIEERISLLVGDKKALFDGLFDGGSDEVAFARSGSFLSRIEKVLPPPVREVPAPGRAAEEEEEDAPEGPPPDSLPPAEPAPDLPVAQAAQPAAPAEARESPPPVPDAIRALFSQLTVRPGPEGRVIFEAPPEVAASLSAVFEGMARMLAPRA